MFMFLFNIEHRAVPQAPELVLCQPTCKSQLVYHHPCQPLTRLHSETLRLFTDANSKRSLPGTIEYFRLHTSHFKRLPTDEKNLVRNLVKHASRLGFFFVFFLSRLISSAFEISHILSHRNFSVWCKALEYLNSSVEVVSRLSLACQHSPAYHTILCPWRPSGHTPEIISHRRSGPRFARGNAGMF